MKRKHTATFVASMFAVPCAYAGFPQFSVGIAEVDNTFRVPEGSGFEPSQWRTLELAGNLSGCTLRSIEYDIDVAAAFHSPGGNVSALPLPASGYDAAPLSRYDSFLRHPTVGPEGTLVAGNFVWDTTTVYAAMFPADIQNLPTVDGGLPIGRVTVPVSSNFNRFNLAGGIQFSCQGEQGLFSATTSLSGPFGVRFDIREINDQYDAQMDLELSMRYEDDQVGIVNEPADIFFPASRIDSVEVLSPATGWHAEKVFVNGRFGIRVRGDAPLPEVEPEIVVVRATLADAEVLRDVRFPLAFELARGFEVGFRLIPKGYWAPTAEGLLAGDTNDDGIVDFTDLNNLLSDFGDAGEGTEWLTDLDGSGTVDFADLNAVLSNFGSEG
jgi:hypothetical protein